MRAAGATGSTTLFTRSIKAPDAFTTTGGSVPSVETSILVISGRKTSSGPSFHKVLGLALSGVFCACLYLQKI